MKHSVVQLEIIRGDWQQTHRC